MAKVMQFRRTEEQRPEVAMLEVYFDPTKTPPIAFRIRLPVIDRGVQGLIGGEGIELGVVLDETEARQLRDMLDEALARCNGVH